MAHAREQIQVGVASVLGIGLSIPVQVERIWVLQQDELPRAGVYLNSETDEQDEGSFDAIGRTLELVVEIVAQGDTGVFVNSILNNAAVEVETALGAERQMLGVLDIVPATWDVQLNSEAEKVTGKGLMGFTVYYRTAIGAPETII